MEWSLIEREGYGAQFNRLWKKDLLLKKEAFTDYGKKKMAHELAFLNFIRIRKVPFPIPEILSSDETSYTMVYYDYETLSKKWPTLSITERADILTNIRSHLHTLHKTEEIEITEEKYNSLLALELIEKTGERLKQIGPLLEKYSHIKKVNQRAFIPLEQIMNFFKEQLAIFLKTSRRSLCPIHGDCQFNNILIGPENEVLFIDPRGYYGTSEIYGIHEYDYAKLAFALSGYDIFDSMKIESLNINNESIRVDDLRISELEPNSFVSVLVLSIWLGNAHCFKNETKAFYSYSYAMWLISLYLERCQNSLSK
jgi:hypothetical protein